MLYLLGGIFLGWSLGANDAANLFGSAVSSHMIRFWKAALLASLFVVLGAVLQGGRGIETLQGLSPLDLELAILTSLAAAATVILLMPQWGLYIWAANPPAEQAGENSSDYSSAAGAYLRSVQPFIILSMLWGALAIAS